MFNEEDNSKPAAYEPPSLLDMGDARDLTNGGEGPKDEEDPNIVWGNYTPEPDDLPL